MLGKIKEKCKEKGITQGMLCARADVNPYGLSRWDKQTPSVDKVYRVAKVLGCSMEELMEE